MANGLSAWIPFFSAVAECTATLAGLVIVAVSVNVQKIISMTHLPTRAFAAIGALMQVLVTSLAALIPQPVQAYAIELALAVLIGWTVHARTTPRVVKGHAALGRPLRERVIMLAMVYAQLLPLSAGAAMVGLGDLRGLYCVALAAVVALMVSALNAWVLLVEILR
ncbi:MAG TPA: hypothetical protein VMU59_00170 [Caulobacteraceae bacterium]|nr:hypothetical protein [Caulobacteraceae bacterium]